MIASLGWLGLDIADADAANAFYEPLLGEPAIAADGTIRYSAGSSDLFLYPPDAPYRGGTHVHYAFSTGADGYAAYKSRLEDLAPVEEYHLAVYRSVYAFDPDDHCVEFAERDDDDEADISGIFEIVLEVEDLERAEAWYRHWSVSLMDRGEDRRRVRLDMGNFELELWEPQRGIADAKPGKSVDLGIDVPDPDTLVERLAPRSRTVQDVERGTRIIDPDEHVLTIY